ncbi:hypothetical protein [uncultured Mucilaginibacter sp.]|uniref:hypothetical protein n=1 Tax=uncultured Mucilaginibacter sp. TaxID=797541 RepID=UPI0025FE39A3|nr:hypothetical protein [uncultured Mucilaginibacter sp.]
MTDKTRKIFFGITIVVPILLYCGYYYGMMVKNAPYRFTDFQYFRLEYGLNDSLVNKYNSKTGNYQYETTGGHIKQLNMKLSKDNLLYLHRKAADLGFWNFPEQEKGDSKKPAPKYLIEFVYKEKSKKVYFDQNYDGDPSLKDANMRLIKEIQKVLDEREESLVK